MADQHLRWRRFRLPFPRLRWWRYRIPFRSPFATAHGRMEERQGVIVALEMIDGRTGWGRSRRCRGSAAAWATRWGLSKWRPSGW